MSDDDPKVRRIQKCIEARQRSWDEYHRVCRELEERYIREGAEAWRAGYLDPSGKVIVMPTGACKGLPLSWLETDYLRSLKKKTWAKKRPGYFLAAVDAELARRKKLRRSHG